MKDMRSLFWRRILLGVAAAALASGLLLCIFAVISLRMNDPVKLNGVFANAALIFGAFLGGRVATVREEGRLVNGLVCGALFALAVLLPSLILSEWSSASLLRVVITVISALTGAILFRRGRSRLSARGARKRLKKRYGKYAA